MEHQAIGRNLDLVSARHGPMMVPRNDIGVGRALRTYGEFGEAQIALFEQILVPNSVVLDIGANLGAFTVPLARMARQVVALEPQRHLFNIMCANLALNDIKNVDTILAAAGARSGTVKVPRLDTDAEVQNWGSLSLDTPIESNEIVDLVAMLMIDELPVERCDLIKIDVEGMECPVLRGARQTIIKFRPVLFVENNNLDRADELYDLIVRFGYRAYWVVTPLFAPGNHYGAQEPGRFGDEKPDDLLCDIDMLCWPEESEVPVTGLRRVQPGETWKDVLGEMEQGAAA